jgi:hypothetical protein
MLRGPLPACCCRHVRVDGLQRPSGRNASPRGTTPSTITSPTLNRGSRTEISPGARTHRTRPDHHAHDPPSQRRSLPRLSPRTGTDKQHLRAGMPDCPLAGEMRHWWRSCQTSWIRFRRRSRRWWQTSRREASRSPSAGRAPSARRSTSLGGDDPATSRSGRCSAALPRPPTLGRRRRSRRPVPQPLRRAACTRRRQAQESGAQS